MVTWMRAVCVGFYEGRPPSNLGRGRVGKGMEKIIRFENMPQRRFARDMPSLRFLLMLRSRKLGGSLLAMLDGAQLGG